MQNCDAPVLSVRGLAKDFRVHQLGTGIPAFADVSFDLLAGGFLLLRGPNGVGKSTLLRAIYRSCLPAAGRALFASSRGPVDGPLGTAHDFRTPSASTRKSK